MRTVQYVARMTPGEICRQAKPSILGGSNSSDSSRSRISSRDQILPDAPNSVKSSASNPETRTRSLRNFGSSSFSSHVRTSSKIDPASSSSVLIWVDSLSSLHRRLNVLFKLCQDAIVQMRAYVATGDGVGLTRINLQVVGNAGLNQLLYKLD